MLGAWRLALALIVVNGHTNDDWWASSFAVFSFYVISGYLITLIMNRTYGFTLGGIRSFLVNRALRIYPPYYAAVALSLLVLALLPVDFVHEINGAIRLPDSLYDAFSNASIFGLYMGQASRLVPPAWALHIELCHYVAIGVLLGRRPAIAAAWLVASGTYFFEGAPRLLETRYFTVLGSSLPFAVGACTYHAGPLLQRLVSSRRAALAVLVAALVLYVAPYAAVKFQGANPLRWAFYANIATTACLLAALTSFRSVAPGLRRFDGFLGDLSYPVYLLHVQAGALTMYVTGIALHTPAAFLATAAASLVLAVLEARVLSRQVERVRTRVKLRLRAGGTAAAAAS